MRGKPLCSEVQMSPKGGKTSFYRFLCAIVNEYSTLATEPVCPDGKLVRFNVQASPKQWSQLVSRGKPTRFEVQTSPKGAKTRFYQFLCPIVYGFLVIQNFFMDVHYDLSNGSSWSRGANRRVLKLKQAPKQTLAMEPVGPEGKTGAF
ncbi:hypothetical protein H5410_021338 [Solanum commersonii]|uniref:Uncharacterized protein n=1 Tax=Solanum commersonii TaxID=4109 RepID=A0A9J5ZB23_SOLCO|nr:hypothetical protein H5410_021338 [Solanum commersonii]